MVVSLDIQLVCRKDKVIREAVGAGKKTNRGNKWKPSHHLWQCDNWERWYYNKQQVLTAQE